MEAQLGPLVCRILTLQGIPSSNLALFLRLCRALAAPSPMPKLNTGCDERIHEKLARLVHVANFSPHMRSHGAAVGRANHPVYPSKVGLLARAWRVPWHTWVDVWWGMTILRKGHVAKSSPHIRCLACAAHCRHLWSSTTVCNPSKSGTASIRLASLARI